ncbi:MAG TPA: hypothetical protein VFN35_09500 [Ktedonobacteraceae bacterium]|nr:hypothetical protein [Ktedonobacteraceae bacterium]
MLRKRARKQTAAIRQGAVSRAKIVTPVMTPPQPVLVAMPVLSLQAKNHRKHNTVQEGALSTAKIAEGLPRSMLVTAPVLAPKAVSRDAHGHFLAKKLM